MALGLWTAMIGSKKVIFEQIVEAHRYVDRHKKENVVITLAHDDRT